MDEHEIRSIVAKVLEEKGMMTEQEMREVAVAGAQHAVVAIFHAFGIRMTEQGVESARTDFAFMHQLRVGSQYTRHLAFKTCFTAMLTAVLTLLGWSLASFFGLNFGGFKK